MKIASLTISGFRCFSANSQTINFDDMTSFVGPNASGKTAAMIALTRLFGESPAQRRIISTDFHLAKEEQQRDQTSRILSVECRLEFPKLDGNEESSNLGKAVAEVFNQMIVDGPDQSPYCRIRLDATWTDDGTALGDIEQNLYWILTDSNDSEVIKDKRRKVQAIDRARIKVLYVPAARDPELQIRGTTSSVFNSLLKSISWDGVDEKMAETLKELREQFGSLNGLKTLNDEVQIKWKDFYKGSTAKNGNYSALA